MNDNTVVAGATDNTEDKGFEKIETEVQETLAVIGQEVQEKIKEIKDKEFVKEQEETMQEVKELNKEYNKSIKELEQERQEGLAEMQESLKEDKEETSVEKSIIIKQVANHHFQVIEVETIKGDKETLLQTIEKALTRLHE